MAKKKFFLGMEPNSPAKISIIPVPLEQTVCYGRGTAFGPEAIIDASYHVESYDEELDINQEQHSVELLDEIPCSNRKIEDILLDIETKVSEVISKGKIPFVLGGEHSITSPAVKAVFKKYPDLTVVQFDAHADLRQEYQGSKHSHACALARVREMCPAVQVGIRSLSPEESADVKEKKYPIFFAHNIYDCKSWMESALKEIKTKYVYITVDVDVFDCGILPETGTPEPGGLNWYDVTKFLRKIFENKTVVGMDVVELAPKEGSNAGSFMIAKLVAKMTRYLSLNPKS